MVRYMGAYKLPPPSAREGTPFPVPCSALTLSGLQDAFCDSPWQGCCGTFGWWAGHSEFSLWLRLSRSVLPTRAPQPTSQRENKAIAWHFCKNSIPRGLLLWDWEIKWLIPNAQLLMGSSRVRTTHHLTLLLRLALQILVYQFPTAAVTNDHNLVA